MDGHEEDVVVPVVAEELHADAIPVQTGGVRVTKRVETHPEILAQELRKTHVEVKRVKTDRVVDGPQPVRRTGNTLIVPVVSEVLRIEKQWVVTEEILITEIEERETVEQTVDVHREVPEIERLDAKGNVLSPVYATPELPINASASSGPASMLSGKDVSLPAGRKKKVLSEPRSLLRDPAKTKGRG